MTDMVFLHNNPFLSYLVQTIKTKLKHTLMNSFFFQSVCTCFSLEHLDIVKVNKGFSLLAANAPPWIYR